MVSDARFERDTRTFEGGGTEAGSHVTKSGKSKAVSVNLVVEFQMKHTVLHIPLLTVLYCLIIADFKPCSSSPRPYLAGSMTEPPQLACPSPPYPSRDP